MYVSQSVKCNQRRICTYVACVDANYVLTEYEYRGGSTNLDCAEYSRIIFFLLIVSYCQKAQQGSTRLGNQRMPGT